MAFAMETSPRNARRDSRRMVRKGATPVFSNSRSSSPRNSQASSPRASPGRNGGAGLDTRPQPLQLDRASPRNLPRGSRVRSPGRDSPGANHGQLYMGHAKARTPRTPRSRTGTPRSRKSKDSRSSAPYFTRFPTPREPVFHERPEPAEMRKAVPQQSQAPPLRVVSNAVELDDACGYIRINDVSFKQLRVVSVSDGPHWLRMKGALRRNTSLQELELVRTRVECKGLAGICPVLGKLGSFKSFVICEDYSVYKEGWESIANMIAGSSSLEFVSVWAPSHSLRYCIEQCARAIRESKSLKTFELHHHAEVNADDLFPLVDAITASATIENHYLPKTFGGDLALLPSSPVREARARKEAAPPADFAEMKVEEPMPADEAAVQKEIPEKETPSEVA